MSKKTRHSQYYYDSISLTDFEVITDNVTRGDVIDKLRTDLSASKSVIDDAVARGAISDVVSLYAHGDKRYVQRTQEARGLYADIFNMDMFPVFQRRRLLDMTSYRISDILPCLAQQLIIKELIDNNPEMDDSDIAQECYKEVKDGTIPRYIPVPTAALVSKIRNNIINGGNSDFASHLTPKLATSRTDAYAAVARHDGRSSIVLTISIAPRKKAVLSFHVPDIPRFRTGMLTKPDIIMDDDGTIRFVFMMKHKAPPTYEPTCALGVDVGVILPYSAAYVSENAHSQVFYPRERILDKVDLIENLQYQKACLQNDIDEDSREKRNARVKDVMSRKVVERDRISNRVSNLRREVAELVARDVCELARSSCAAISLERLGWSVSSHAFFHRMIHDAIVSMAARYGIPVSFESAAGTSSRCPYDGGELEQGRCVGSPVSVPVSRKRRVGSRGVRVFRGVRCDVDGRVYQHDGVSPLSLGVRCLRGSGLDVGFCSRVLVRCRRGDCWVGAPSSLAAVSEVVASSVVFSAVSRPSGQS